MQDFFLEEADKRDTVQEEKKSETAANPSASPSNGRCKTAEWHPASSETETFFSVSVSRLVCEKRKEGVKAAKGPLSAFTCCCCKRTFSTSDEYRLHRTAKPILSRSLAFLSKTSFSEVEWQKGYPGFPGCVSDVYRPIDYKQVFLLNSHEVCKCRDMLRRFGVFFHQSIMCGSVQALKEELERRHSKAASDCDVYVHDYFVDGQPREDDEVQVPAESLKDFTPRLRCDLHRLLQTRIFPDKVVTYQTDWDKYRVLKGEYETALHIDHCLQHKYTGYNPQNVTVMTTWVSLNSSGPREGLSVLFPRALSGSDAVDGLWGAMNAQAGSLLIFLETTPHANFKSTQYAPSKALRMSVEMRWTVCDHEAMELGPERLPFLSDSDPKIVNCSLCLVPRSMTAIAWPSPLQCWLFAHDNSYDFCYSNEKFYSKFVSLQDPSADSAVVVDSAGESVSSKTKERLVVSATRSCNESKKEKKKRTDKAERVVESEGNDGDASVKKPRRSSVRKTSLLTYLEAAQAETVNSGCERKSYRTFYCYYG